MKFGQVTFGFAVSMAALMYAEAYSDQTLKPGDGKRWYRGNTHTHTLWSDGDAAPEVSVAWYKDHGYDFLCLSDHNILSQGERWFEIDPPPGVGRVNKKGKVERDDRLTSERLQAIIAQFGKDWVQLKEENGRRFMRLKTLDELKTKFEQPEKFLLIQAEEISNPMSVHLGALNLKELVPPQDDATPALLIRKSLEAVEEQSKRLGVPMLAHINHPNFSKGITAEDMIEVGGERFFEVYNGHGNVRNWGDEKERMPSTDRLWDIILSMRLRKEGSAHPMLGMGTDDTHAYFKQRIGLANAGRGWVMVLADKLTPDVLIEAMKRGDFYPTSGVILDEISSDKKSFRVAIKPEDGISYTTQFIGTRKGFDASSKPALDDAGKEMFHATRQYSGEIGIILKETRENPAVYEFKGDEMYVRAKVVSSKLKANPHAEGDREMAWTQPVVMK